MSDSRGVFDPNRRKEIPYLMSKLDGGQPSTVIYKSLSCLRSYFFSSFSSAIHPKLKTAVENGQLLKALLKLLEKPNAKIVDVTLSILGNLFLVESVRIQLCDKSLRGIPLVVSVLENITEESIICRVCRVVANLAQNRKLCRQFNERQIFTVLVKATKESQFVAKTHQVIVRAVRILGTTPDEKKNAIESNAIAMVANHLQTSDEDLLKAVTKCLAHYTHGCTLEIAQQVSGDGYDRYKILVELMDHPNRSIWEAAMAITVNLAHVSVLRPTLGNMGAIAALVTKLESRCELGLSSKEIAHCVTALCLFCRESVNRMKIRECHGLRLIVAILNDFTLYKLFDRIVNSLLQFSFDSASLSTLQNEGLVQTLVSYIWAYTEKYGVVHQCSYEKAPLLRYCANEDDPDLPHGFNPSGLPEMVDEDDVLDANDIPEDIAPPEPEAEEDNQMEPVDLNDEEIAAMNLQDPPSENNAKEPIVFRVNSPSYQAVQDEYSEIMRRQEAMANSLWVKGPAQEGPSGPGSPDRSPYPWMGSPEQSPGYSLEGSPVSLASRSPQKSPERGSPLTLPKYSPLPFEPQINDDQEEDIQSIYSPVERFSDDEEDVQPCSSRTAETRDVKRSRPVPSSPIPKEPLVKKPREMSPIPTTSNTPPRNNVSFNNFSPGVSPLNQAKALPTFAPLPHPPQNSPARSDIHEEKRENSLIGWVLHILSLLSQPAHIHEHMLNIATTQVLVKYLINCPNPLPRAGRILIRLSKNIYSTMSFINQRHMSWLTRTIENRPTVKDKNLGCKSCENLELLRDILVQNISVFAESGYCEGQICLSLMRGTKQEKQNVAISAAILIRGRKLLRNVLITHDGLEVLLDVCESVDNVDDPALFSDAVLSCSNLGAHVGVVALDLLLDPKEDTNCFHDQEHNDHPKDLTLTLDDGSEIQVHRETIAKASPVFGAMFTGGFMEAGQSKIKIPFLSHSCLKIVLHHLYGCVWCDAFKGLEVSVLMELVSVSDQFLLPDLNQTICHEITTRCLNVKQVVEIYQTSLQREYLVHGSKDSLSKCAVNYLIVGEMSHSKRVQLWEELLKSRAKSDFVDDVGKTIRSKLLEMH